MPVRVIDNAVNIPIILLEEGQEKLKESGYQYVHIGLIVIGIKGLVKKETETRVLVQVLNHKWGNNFGNAQIGGMEVYMSQNTGFHYCARNLCFQ